MKNYQTEPMAGITEQDYDTVLMHLADQLSALLHGFPEGEPIKAAFDALTNEWQDTMTAKQWLAAAGSRLGVDTTDCMGV